MARNRSENWPTLAAIIQQAKAYPYKSDPLDPQQWRLMEAQVYAATHDLEIVAAVRAWMNTSFPRCRLRRRWLVKLNGRRFRLHADAFRYQLPLKWSPDDKKVAVELIDAMRGPGSLQPIIGQMVDDSPAAELAVWQAAAPSAFAVMIQLPWFGPLPLLPPKGDWVSLTEALMWIAFGYAVVAATLVLPPVGAVGHRSEELRRMLEWVYQRIAAYASANDFEIRGRPGQTPEKAGDERRLTRDELRNYVYFDWVNAGKNASRVSDAVQKFPADEQGLFQIASSEEPVCVFDVCVSVRDLLNYCSVEEAILRQTAKGYDPEPQAEAWLRHYFEMNPRWMRPKTEICDEAKDAITGLNTFAFNRVWQRVSKSYPWIAAHGRKPKIKPKLAPEIDQ